MSPRPGVVNSRTVLVCGAGLMGQGIAQTLAVAGHAVRLFEPEHARAEAGLARIGNGLDRMVASGRLTVEQAETARQRVSVAPDLATAVEGIDIAIEAIVEEERAKRALFEELDGVAPLAAILASNTSSLSIATLVSATRRARRGLVIGMHFFSPVPSMPVVEIIRGPDTSDATVDLVRALAESMAKTPLMSADRPGFMVNRMLFPLLAEAMRELEEGVGSATDIDAAARLGLGHPMGPLELADRIGLDVCLSILEVLAEGIDGHRFRPPDVLRDILSAGHLGRKTGRGFHTYPDSAG
ncbi:MAG: 3-hydroxybutyryl-CoA dehydrogenase [Chloroflexi bacterium]|nr:3-hydroxybutyryl-CoA dehydrogenase [Chloroflexota bacterium]